MRRTRPLLVLAAGLGCVATACGGVTPPGFGTADDDDATDDDDDVPTELDFGLPEDSLLGDVIRATIRVPGYGGAVSFFHVGGELPPGLRVTANGVIEGVVEAAGSYTFSVQATEMSIPDIVDDAAITVELPDVPLHLGVPHDRTTTLTGLRDFQLDPWFRIQAEGAPEWTEVTVEVGLFHPGLNGENDRGWGDDLFVQSIPFESCDLELGKWTNPDDTDCDPDDRPPHCIEEDPMVYEGGGRFRTGADTGRYDVTLTCSPHGSIDFRVLAVPPGWCPLGHHYGGPSWQHPGACEP